MAVTAVEIHGARSLVALGRRIDSRKGIDSIDTGVAVMRVVMVAEVSGAGLRLVLAVRGHGRPAELERQQGEKDDGEQATHGGESSG